MKFDTRDMQASGMTNQQINDLIKRKNADISGPRGMDPKGYDVKPQVMPSVKPSVKPRINQNRLQKAYGDVFRQASGTTQKVDTTIPPGAVVPQQLSTPKQYKQAEATHKKIQQQQQLANSVGKPQQTNGLGQVGSQLATPVGGTAAKALGLGMKKGGSANHYTKGGKINLDACGVSTGGKSNKCAGW